MAASRQDKTHKLGFFLIKKVPCECLCLSGCLLYVTKRLLPSLECGRNHFAENMTQCHSKLAVAERVTCEILVSFWLW